MSRILIVSPHPDDALFFMGGALLQAVETGIGIDLWCMSDGERGGMLTWSKSRRLRLARRRARELRDGLPSSADIRLREFHLPDGDTRPDPRPTGELASAFHELGAIPYTAAYVPEYREEYRLFRHPDHIRCGRAFAEWLGGERALIETPVYFYHSRRADVTIALSEAVNAEVFRLLREHRSQYGLFAFPPFLLQYGERVRERWLRREGARAGFRRAESFRRQAPSEKFLDHRDS